jgi:NADPH:quinone reductase-like Zn-dependent oxidoreductase
MKAIQVHQFLPVSDFHNITSSHMTMAENVPRPTIRHGQMLVKVLACSVSPGDVMMVGGNLILMHRPFPFIPGMDICGVVEEDPNGDTNNLFQKGDVIVASNGMSPVGGLAEYMAVDIKQAVQKPANVINLLEAAASSSAITARNAVMDHVKPGDRVLILGGSGGVGSAAIQMAKRIAQASFVATTSTQEAFCQKLGADQVINYRNDKWWEMKDYRVDQFDVIIDCVGGGNYYDRATHVLKPGRAGGRFLAVTGDNPQPDCRTVWTALQFFANLPWRPLYAWWHSNTLPKYVLIMPYKIPEGRAQVLKWMAEGRLSIPLEKEYPFTEVGVRDAFSKVGTGHAHGKVVITVLQQ